MEDVTGCSRPCATVLHRARFWRGLVLACAELCWAVGRHLVGKLAAGAVSGRISTPPKPKEWSTLVPFTGMKYEHLYQREIETATDLAQEVEGFPVSFNEIRPHEALGQRPPLDVHLAGPHLFRGALQVS